MIKNIFLAAFLLTLDFNSLAQTPAEAGSELSSTPPALAPLAEINKPQEKSVKTTLVQPRKISYGLSAGTQFSRLFGTATFLEPSVMFPLIKRFSGFASLNFVTSFNSNTSLFGNENFSNNYATMRNQRFILNAGGNYLVNDRLNLTGSVWRDFSKNQLPAPLNLYMPGGSNGMSFRANYKVTENFSVSGGVRYSNGNSYNNRWYNPGSTWEY